MDVTKILWLIILFSFFFVSHLHTQERETKIVNNLINIQKRTLSRFLSYDHRQTTPLPIGDYAEFQEFHSFFNTQIGTGTSKSDPKGGEIKAVCTTNASGAYSDGGGSFHVGNCFSLEAPFNLGEQLEITLTFHYEFSGNIKKTEGAGAALSINSYCLFTTSSLKNGVKSIHLDSDSHPHLNLPPKRIVISAGNIPLQTGTVKIDLHKEYYDQFKESLYLDNYSGLGFYIVFVEAVSVSGTSASSEVYAQVKPEKLEIRWGREPNKGPNKGEKTDLLKIFPNLNVDSPKFRVTQDGGQGKQLTDYNCIAWSAEVTNRWIWPPLECPDCPEKWVNGILVSKCSKPFEVFDDFYTALGFEATNERDGQIALFYFENDPCHGNVPYPTHGAIYGTGHGLPWENWESKLGQDIQIQHDLHAMKGGIYGKIKKYYSKARQVNIQDVMSPLEEVKAEQLLALNQHVNSVNPELRQSFDRYYNEWMEGCKKLEIAMSPNPGICTKVPEFRKITALGQEIIPLVFLKVVQGNTPAIQIYYSLTSPNFRSVRKDGKILGERVRAIRFIKMWLGYDF